MAQISLFDCVEYFDYIYRLLSYGLQTLPDITPETRRELLEKGQSGIQAMDRMLSQVCSDTTRRFTVATGSEETTVTMEDLSSQETTVYSLTRPNRGDLNCFTWHNSSGDPVETELMNAAYIGFDDGFPDLQRHKRERKLIAQNRDSHYANSTEKLHPDDENPPASNLTDRTFPASMRRRFAQLTAALSSPFNHPRKP